MIHWRYLTWKDYLGFLLVIAIVATWLGWQYITADAFVAANQGFGPEWSCTNPYNKGPICVKKPVAAADWP